GGGETHQERERRESHRALRIMVSTSSYQPDYYDLDRGSAGAPVLARDAKKRKAHAGDVILRARTGVLREDAQRLGARRAWRRYGRVPAADVQDGFHDAGPGHDLARQREQRVHLGERAEQGGVVADRYHQRGANATRGVGRRRDWTAFDHGANP